jgi:type II secretory pathway pseudopilin PulG
MKTNRSSPQPAHVQLRRVRRSLPPTPRLRRTGGEGGRGSERGEGGDLSRRSRTPAIGAVCGEGGYILLGVVIIVVIMGIFMGLAVPVWQHVMKREREEELLWRGRQYVRAIELYQTKYPGAFPPSIDVLVEQKFLRKAYPDPMVEDGEWKILRQLSPEIRQMMNPAARGRGEEGEGRRGRGPGLSPSQSQSSSQRSSRTRSSTSRVGAGSGEQGLGGIVGVMSRSEEESIRIIDGKDNYSEWLFVYMQEARGTRRPGAGRRRQPGFPGQQPGMGGRQPGLPGQQRGLGRSRGQQRRQPPQRQR